MTEGEEHSTHHGIRFVKGEVVQRVEYTPFGRERYVLHPELSEGPRFTGQTYDMEDGLYYYKARYYDPVLGRFIQPDPILAGVSSQEINRYSYALNNPLKYIDPTGNYIEGPDGERYRDVDAAIRDAEAKEPGEGREVLEGSGTVGDGGGGQRMAGNFSLSIPGRERSPFHFEGLDRDLDGDYDVADRVIEREMKGGARLDFGLDRGLKEGPDWFGLGQSFIEAVLEATEGMKLGSLGRALLGAVGKSVSLLGIITYEGGFGGLAGGLIGGAIGGLGGAALVAPLGLAPLGFVVGSVIGSNIGEWAGRELFGDSPYAGSAY